MNAEPPRYLSYLLRLWQTSSNGEQVWRASLEEPGSGERQGFASPEALFDFLAAQTGRGAKKPAAMIPGGDITTSFRKRKT